MKETLADFWRMVWLTQSHIIVMCTNLEEAGVNKCERYWPEAFGPEHSMMFDDELFVVAQSQQKPCPQFQVTKLELTHNGETRVIDHYWWIGWPDKGVPASTTNVVDFVLTTRKQSIQLGGPLIIHCSAGVGRTGCLLAIDICIQQVRDRLDLSLKRIGRGKNKK